MDARSWHWPVALAAVAMLPGSGADAAERKPRLAFSIAENPALDTPRGPLFAKVAAAIAAAEAGDAARFRAALAPGATLRLRWFEGTTLREAPLTMQTIRAAARSCAGPYPYDESAGWAQLSWVCRTDRASPLSAALTFRDSPELSLTVWFEKGLIKAIDAIEPLPVPGVSRVGMDAYARLKRSR